MSHINILIVDDDLEKITVIIATLRKVVQDTLSISQANCVQDALEYLKEKEFHLLITDFNMPLRFDTPPDRSGGLNLIRAIYKTRNNLNVPLYIVCLTQFKDLKGNYDGVWKVWFYDNTDDSWQNKLREIVFHISLIKTRIISDKIETLFVEGYTDKRIIETTIKYYFPSILNKVKIEAINYGGGASWVERQIVIWGKTLTKNSAGNNYLKAVALFDDDDAGYNAIENVNRLIDINSAERKTFSILTSCYKYSILLKSIKSKGISLQTTIEDLFPIECYKIAKTKGWLSNRNTNTITIDFNKLKIEKSCLNYKTLNEHGFTDDEIIIILSKIDNDCKNKFCELVTNDFNNLLFVSYLVKNIIIKLKLVEEDDF